MEHYVLTTLLATWAMLTAVEAKRAQIVAQVEGGEVAYAGRARTL